MEKLTLEQALNEISQAYSTLDSAKADCNDVVESALDAYFGETPEAMTKKELKAIKAARKTEIKNIKKVAKAMAAGNKDGVEEEADSMQEILSAIK